MAGIVSGFLPIVQGWVFILAGLTVMAPESHCARRLLHWAKEKFRVHSKKDAGDGTGPGRCAQSMTTSDPGPSVPPGTYGGGGSLQG